MTSEFQVFSKDKIKLNILQDVLSGMINLGFQFDDGNVKDYASHIHEDGKRVFVCGKFNISEDANGGDTLTIRPIMIDGSLRISFHANANFSGKKAVVVRNATKMVEQEYEISSETSFIEFVPEGKQCYVMKVLNGGGIATHPLQGNPQSQRNVSHKPEPQSKPVVNSTSNTVDVFEEVDIKTEPSITDDRFQGFDLDTGINSEDNRFETFDVDQSAVVSDNATRQTLEPTDEIATRGSNTSEHPNVRETTEFFAEYDDKGLQRIEQEISVVERQQGQLSQKKQSAINHLEKIEAEYKKDYASLEKELDEIKSRMEADASVIDHYKEQDVMPIEIIFQEIRLKLEEAEEQIRFFIEAKQRKTMEIENEIKSNKKQ